MATMDSYFKEVVYNQQCSYVHHPSAHSVTIAMTEQCKLVQHSYMYKYVQYSVSKSCDINMVIMDSYFQEVVYNQQCIYVHHPSFCYLPSDR